MAIYGYTRESAISQSLTIQELSLKVAGCGVICVESANADKTSEYPELNVLLEFLRKGDVLVVTNIDRLAGSIRKLSNLLYILKNRGVILKVIEQPIDTSTEKGTTFFELLGVIADFERNIRKERQMEGVAIAKAKGVYKGRKPAINKNDVLKFKREGLGASAIAKELGIGRASVYRVLANSNIV